MTQRPGHQAVITCHGNMMMSHRQKKGKSEKAKKQKREGDCEGKTNKNDKKTDKNQGRDW